MYIPECLRGSCLCQRETSGNLLRSLVREDSRSCLHYTWFFLQKCSFHTKWNPWHRGLSWVDWAWNWTRLAAIQSQSDLVRPCSLGNNQNQERPLAAWIPSYESLFLYHLYVLDHPVSMLSIILSSSCLPRDSIPFQVDLKRRHLCWAVASHMNLHMSRYVSTTERSLDSCSSSTNRLVFVRIPAIAWSSKVLSLSATKQSSPLPGLGERQVTAEFISSSPASFSLYDVPIFDKLCRCADFSSIFVASISASTVPSSSRATNITCGSIPRHSIRSSPMSMFSTSSWGTTALNVLILTEPALVVIWTVRCTIDFATVKTLFTAILISTGYSSET